MIRIDPRHIGAAALAAGALALPCAAASEELTPLFASDEAIEIVIDAPLNTLVGAAENSTDPYPATLTLMSGPDAPRSFAIELSARGITRRARDICRFPPLRVDFDKDDLDDTLFDGQNRIKLVTHCRRQASYEQLYVLEYVAYRIYNLFTPMSFNVRPAQVTYRDTDGRRSDITRFGFFIEDVDDLAARNGREELEVVSIRASQLAPDAAARYALFQFMIGNLDWSFLDGPADEECCHNTKLIARPDSPDADIVPAPYDFDFSGFVDASYATPPDAINVRSVRQRRYRGMCRHAAELTAAADQFRANRDAIFALVADEPRLDERNRRQATGYLENFFEILDDPSRFERDITRRCRD